jgi:hypothetical protein
MIAAELSDRIDCLIDDLILDGGVEAASLASILLAARDAARSDYHVIMSRWVWSAADLLRRQPEAPPPEVPPRGPCRAG